MDNEIRIAVAAVLSFIGSLYLFGWLAAIVVAILIVLSSAFDFLRWEAFRVAGFIFLVAVILMLIPDEKLGNLSFTISQALNQTIN